MCALGRVVGPALCIAAFLYGFQVSPIHAQTTEMDSTFADNQKVPLIVSLDSLMLEAQVGVTSADLESRLGPFDLTIIRELPGGLYIARSDVSRTRAQLDSLAREIEVSLDDYVDFAGLVVRLSPFEPPIFVTARFVAQFQPGVARSTIDGITQAYFVDIVRENPFVPNQFLLEVTEDSPGDAIQVANLFHASASTAFALPNFVWEVHPTAWVPNDPYFDDQWHLDNTQTGADIEAVKAWNISQGDPNTVIAIIEIGGFALPHPDLTGNLWVNPGETSLQANPNIDDDLNGFTDDVNGWNFRTDSPDLTMTTGTRHGTAVAGLAAAIGDNGTGVSGVCPRCRLMLLVARGHMYESAAAIYYAAAMGADVISNSWSTAIQNKPLHLARLAVDYATTQGRGGLGTVVLFSAHNYDVNRCMGEYENMMSYPNVIGVARSDYEDKKAESGWGHCLDLLAPGGDSVGIATTDRTGTEGYNNAHMSTVCKRTEPGPGDSADARDYTFCFGGSSAATPIVAGVAGLLLSHKPNLKRAEVETVLRQTADKIDASAAQYDLNGFSKTHGFGRVNAYRALTATVVMVDWPEFEVGTGAGFTYLWKGPGQGALNAPGSGAMANPVVLASWYPPSLTHLRFDSELGFSYISFSGGKDESRLVLTAQPAYQFAPASVSAPYLAGNLALQHTDVAGATNFDYALGSAIGYRWLLRPFFALRLEGRYRYWIDSHTHETGLRLSFGVLFD